ncbi:putative integrase catalytic domain-containing protein [Phytophthora infestans]|uniref:Putative integrase catalytic domain-containing protein n=1 Tax=Phytophthora infestans TaxID=4787 RepID=A0A833RTL7_PHYIN|nr:putative integrase catalytic domain-containing protein [Phytophthora infestans]
MKDLQWKQQFCETIEALEQNNTRELVKRPRGAKRPHTKCILKLNETTHGSKRYKARSVVRGDQQEYGKVPARPGEFRTCRHVCQGKKKESNIEILLHISLGMTIGDALLKHLYVKDKRELVLCQKKRPYGLKQSRRLWNLM